MGPGADPSSGASPQSNFAPPVETSADGARRQRALRRVERQRTAPAWLKRIPWVLFPVYGFIRLADPNYEEHYEQWKEEQRSNYDGRDAD